MVVGGGDSAVEAALLLSGKNEVTLTYRGDKFSRIKPKNAEKIMEAIENQNVNVLFHTEVKKIEKETILLEDTSDSRFVEMKNDLVYIFAGGELPVALLKKAGVSMTTKRGEVYMTHTK